MNNIPVEQNSDGQLRRLAAQRQLYSKAKRIFGLQIFISGPVAVVSAFIALLFPETKGYVALWGVLVTMADFCWLTPWQKHLRGLGARVQEQFDCDVLILPWNDLKGPRPDPELIKEQSEKYYRRMDSMPTLKDWYSPEVGSLPIHLARIACQRSNCWWDSEQRRRYAYWILGSVSIVFVIVLLLAVWQKLTVADFVLKVVSPLAPTLTLGVRQFIEQLEAASRLQKLKSHCESLWAESLNRKPEDEVTNLSRRLQDEIFENRSRSPFVFDFIFKRIRNSYEVQMAHGVAESVVEAKKRLK